MFKFKYKANVNVITLVFFFLGIFAGLFLPNFVKEISFLGDIYINALKIMIVPLIMTQVIISISEATSKSFSKRIIGTILVFILMFICSFCLMSVFTYITNPGRGALFDAEYFQGNLAAVSAKDFFLSIIPDNLFSAMSKNAILPCIIFSFIFGIALSKSKSESLLNVLKDLDKTLNIVLSYLMWLAPLGVFALVGNAVLLFGSDVVQTCIMYILVAWSGSILVILIIMILPVYLYANISPIKYIKKVSQVWVTTVSTCSSAVALPQTIKVCTDSFGVSKEVTNVVVPLGCTIHMCGGAVSFCLLGLFTLQVTGEPITFSIFLYMLLIATLMNMAAPGIPGGGIVLGATYLNIIGSSTFFIGIYSGIYRLLDMIYTTLNVTGDITANILIHTYESKKKAKLNA